MKLIRQRSIPMMVPTKSPINQAIMYSPSSRTMKTTAKHVRRQLISDGMAMERKVSRASVTKTNRMNIQVNSVSNKETWMASRVLIIRPPWRISNIIKNIPAIAPAIRPTLPHSPMRFVKVLSEVKNFIRDFIVICLIINSD